MILGTPKKVKILKNIDLLISKFVEIVEIVVKIVEIVLRLFWNYFEIVLGRAYGSEKGG